jgi:outer membrane protein assembly factor BamB
MNKINKFFFITLIFIYTSSCSFDKKTGIWESGEKEKERIAALENEQNKIKDTTKIYSSYKNPIDEVIASQNVILTVPYSIDEWKMPGHNLQNSISNVYLSGIDNRFLKKRIGKNKFSISQVSSPPLYFDGNIIITDDVGSIYSVHRSGKKNWKKNIYKKVYKKIYKNLSTFIYKDKIFVADNIGFIYSINLSDGKLNWIKNHGVPIKSNIKVFDNKIFVVNQDNRLIAFNTQDGAKIWDVRSISTFIKSQYFLSLAITQSGDIVMVTSSGDLVKVQGKNGTPYWSQNVTSVASTYSNDFFKSSDVLIDNNTIFFSTTSSIYSFNLMNGYLNWQKKVSSSRTPIINGNYIFIVSENGYFLCLDKKTGKIIWSINTFKTLKQKKQNTTVTGFILGSGKMYITTLNGFLIVCSANNGSIEHFKSVGDKITAPPIIVDASLYILTEDSKILGYN